MKVQRYQYGKTNLRELASQKANLVSPETMAAAAAAPYDAVAQVAGQVSSDITKVQLHNQQLQKEEDAIAEKLAMEKTKANTIKWENNEGYQDQLQPDGTPTASVMLEDFEGILNSTREELKTIQDPTTRANAEKMFEITSETARLEARKIVNDKRKNWNAQGQFDLREIMFEAGDWTAFRDQNQEMLDEGLITSTQYSAAETSAQKVQLDDQAQLIADNWEEQHMKGNGPAAYEQIVKSDLPDDLKKLTISKVENQMENLDKVDKKKAAIAKVEVLKDQTMMKIAIELDQPLPMSVGEFVNSGMGYTPEMDAQMITWGQELLLKQIKGTEQDKAFNEFMVGRRNGIFQENTKANSKNLDKEIQMGITEDMTPQDVRVLGEATMKDAGFLSFSYDQMFNTSPRTAESLGQAAQMWDELMLNTDINSALQSNVTDENQTVLTDAARAIRAGINPTEAGEMAISMSREWDKNKPEMQARQDYYGGRNTQGKGRGNAAAKDGFKSLIDDSFDTVGWLDLMPMSGGTTGDIGQAEFLTDDYQRSAFAFYEEYFYDAYMRTNDMASATSSANLMFSQNFNMNNINGEMQIEKGGVKGDWNWKREEWIQENSSDTFIFGEGGAAMGSLDKVGDIIYRNPVTVGDQLVYEIWNETGPLMQDVMVDGNLDRQQVIDTIPLTEKNTKEVEDIQKEADEKIADLKKEYETALRMKDNIYVGEKSAETIRDYDARVAAEQRRADKAIEQVEGN